MTTEEQGRRLAGISHEQARESAQRLINSHFRQEPHARVSIPARPGHDDDLIIMAYIEQHAATAPQGGSKWPDHEWVDGNEQRAPQGDAGEVGLIEDLVSRYGALSKDTMAIYNATITQREQAARAQERERCAKVAEECVLGFHAEADELEAANRLVDTVSRQIAAAIRNPGQVEK
jgi:hypothetical protein